MLELYHFFAQKRSFLKFFGGDGLLFPPSSPAPSTQCEVRTKSKQMKKLDWEAQWHRREFLFKYLFNIFIFSYWINFSLKTNVTESFEVTPSFISENFHPTDKAGRRNKPFKFWFTVDVYYLNNWECCKM